MAKNVITRKEGAPQGGWMLTFSDMNTLLLTFFVLLFSMSSINPDKFEEMTSPSTEGDGLGLLSDMSQTYNSGVFFDPFPFLAKHAVSSALDVFRTPQDQPNMTIGLPEGVEFELTDDPYGEVAIVMADKLLFAPEATELSDESKDFLRKVRMFLNKVLAFQARRVVIEGHTDDAAPQEERFIVSAERAEKVLEFLLSGSALPPSLFSTVGYGDAKPFVPNNSDENRAKNRRVRIVLEPPDLIEANDNEPF